MRRTLVATLLTALMVITVVSTSGKADTVQVRQTFSGTALRTGYDMNEDPASARGATLVLWKGKGTFGPFTAKTYFDVVTVTPTVIPDPYGICEGGYLYEIDTENLNDPVTNAPNSFVTHLQEFENGDLLYWALDTSQPHPDFWCFDPATPGVFTRTSYLNYDGGTGRFAGAEGGLIWQVTIERRVGGFVWAVYGTIEGELILVHDDNGDDDP